MKLTMMRRGLLPMVVLGLVPGMAVGQAEDEKPFPSTAVESVRLVESGAILAEDFDNPRLDLSRWRVWQENPDQTSVRQERGRLTLAAQGRIGHNGLWGLTTAKYKDVVLVGEMDIRSEGPAPHRLALHLCGGDGARSPDHWVEIDMVDLGQTARFSSMAALPIGLDRQQDKSLELPHPSGQGFLCRLSLNGQTNLVDLSIKTEKGWLEICPPVPLPLRTIHTEVKMHGNAAAPSAPVEPLTKSQAWFDIVRIYSRPENHHVGIRLVRADGRQIWFREGDGWPPKIIDGQGKARSIEDLEVQLWTADGKTQVAASRSDNMGFYLLPLKNAPWDVYPIAAELRVLLDGRILGKPLRIECQGVHGLYPDDVYDIIFAEPGKASSRPDARATTTTSAAAETTDETDLQIVRPEISTAPLLNPGKGWVLYDMPDSHRGGSRPYGTIGYKRFNWCEVEPAEGQYNWKPIDEFIAAWKKEGLPVAFGVMTANIHYKGMYVTPKWVFDAGCKPRTVQQKRPETAKDVAAFYQYEGPQVIPADWLDPVYLAKLEEFLTALAKRYDGRPDLGWYEIRAYGNWGEGHLWPWRGEEPSPEQIFEHYILLHRRLFPKSMLMANETYFRSKELHLRAARIGVGVRDDGVMSFRDGGTTAECDGLAPTCFEWGCSYAQAAREGLLTKQGRSLEDCIRNGHVYYCGLARGGAEDIKAFAQNEKPLIDHLTNLMGYHLVIDEATLPKTLAYGHEFSLTLTWHNAGVARMWFPCGVAVALLVSEVRVVARTWLDESQPGACPGGQRRTEPLKARLEKIPVGEYRLAIGVFRDRQARQPDVKLGLKDITPDSWHPLARVAVNSAQQDR
jgi:hypothetical protein